jgi:sulfur-oxidizing protein SoxZ
MARVLLNLPRSAAKGAVIEIRTLIMHPMESGFRPGTNGTILARDIITRFSCSYNGEQVFQAELSSAIAANPFISFTTVATESGTLSFTWEGDNDFRQTETRDIAVT